MKYCSPLAAVWTHIFTCAQRVSYFHICWHPDTRCVIKNDLFTPLAAVWTHAFTCVQRVSYFHVWLTWLGMKGCSFLHLLLGELTFTFTCAQRVSYFHINVLTQDVLLTRMIALFSTCCCVNSCVHLCSAGKLLSYLVNVLRGCVIKKEWLLFSPLAMWTCVFSCAQRVSY